jgi:hypothetical protein
MIHSPKSIDSRSDPRVHLFDESNDRPVNDYFLLISSWWMLLE